MNIEINMPCEVEKALNILNSNGFEAYIVGGCVRDAILGAVPSDWDITTSAKPDEIINCFKDYRTIETGLKHGTVTVVINHMHMEITTYRIDGKYSDNRRPDTVLYTDKISMDLKRRDFTVNALAYNCDGIVDLFGGINDIEKKTIKCVGDPDERFNEDGLRILRALRFASVLCFNIEENTSKRIHENKNLLNNISCERINSEFCKLVLGKNFNKIMLEYKDVIEVFIPSIKKLNKEDWKQKINSMAMVPNDLILKFTLLFYKIDDIENILTRLKNDNVTIKNVRLLTLNIDEEVLPTPINVKRWLNKIGYDNLNQLFNVKKAVVKSFDKSNETELENLEKAELLMNEAVKQRQCFSLKTLAINGKDLLEAGIAEGEQLGEILDEILDKVIEGKLENQKSVLMDYIKFYRK
ncbi:MAG: CCA tRNA nucleotidyltransferase [Sedimentibacter sp.]|uniref:CCA tRNA nucleotidyltransferase n=1 Tax=Sedimentibacter sp. TaxID=1960295 RepID=UPI0029823780|nr:CCA tRNA nucleotidyltransferase [Sedimentibacter sp.]MDW5299710.1 CCA tRNA nucleotidyltransferase [Sedimentibacter sp.]